MVNVPLFKGFHTCQVVGLGISGCHQPYLTERGKKWKIMDSKVPAGICDSWDGTAPDLLVDRKAMFDVEAQHNAGNDV